MKKNYISSVCLFFLILTTFSCKDQKAETSGHHEEGLSENIKKMVNPVNEKIIATAPTIFADSGNRLFEIEVQGKITYDDREKTALSSRIAGRIERLAIKYNFQPVKKGQLIMEIYSTDLVAAQRELLFLQKENLQGNLKQSAMQKLLYLGMSQSQINQVLKSRKPQYRVGVYSPISGFIVEESMNAKTNTLASLAETDSSPIMIREGQYLNAGEKAFTIYGNSNVIAQFSLDAQEVFSIKTGQTVLLSSINNPQNTIAGKIDLIQPTIRNGENFSLIRVYLPPGDFLIGEMLQASVPLFMDKGWWLPQSAVIDLGARSNVFVKDGEVFIPKRIETGMKANGYIQVLTDIGTWPIAEDAGYLVDSESFIVLKDPQ